MTGSRLSRHRRLSGRRLLHLACILALVGLALLYFWRYLGWIGPQASFGPSDFTNLYWPYQKFNVHEWRAGRVPLWDNSVNGGQPHLANPETAVFYPLALVNLVLDGRGGPVTLLYTRLWLDTAWAAVGMYLLVRRLTGHPAGGLVSALALPLGLAVAALLLGAYRRLALVWLGVVSPHPIVLAAMAAVQRGAHRELAPPSRRRDRSGGAGG